MHEPSHTRVGVLYLHIGCVFVVESSGYHRCLSGMRCVFTVHTASAGFTGTRPPHHWSKLAPSASLRHLQAVYRQHHCAVGMSATAAAGSAAQPAGWDEYNQRWYDIWDGGLQPGQSFDKGAASPQLLHLLQSGDLDARGQRVLVPGCGRGYDVVAFARAGAAHVVGLDLSPTALEAARVASGPLLAAPGGAPGAVEAAVFQVGDFFKLAEESKAKSGAAFDYGYDYTFLCALHPDMRTSWAAAWASLLVPGGQLLTMVYPVDPSLADRPGPPWPVTPDLYEELLLPAGFELLSLQPIAPELSHEARRGREWLGRWRRVG